MIILQTLKGCLMFLGIISLLFFIVICAELVVILAKDATGSETLHKNVDHDKIKQKPDRGYSEEKDIGE